MEPDQELLQDPRFQVLMAKAETHQREFRPQETEQLEREERLQAELYSRSKACWDVMKAARQSGMDLFEAQEVALPYILVPDEGDEPGV